LNNAVFQQVTAVSMTITATMAMHYSPSDSSKHYHSPFLILSFSAGELQDQLRLTSSDLEGDVASSTACCNNAIFSFPRRSG
jgi:hypothetical protein